MFAILFYRMEHKGNVFPLGDRGYVLFGVCRSISPFFLFRLVGSDVDILPPSVSSCGRDGQRPVLASVPDPVRVVFVSLAASIASSVAGSNFEKN